MFFVELFLWWSTRLLQQNVYKLCSTKHCFGAFFGALTPLLLDSNIFWRLAITCSGPESLTPQLHIYQLELYPLPNVSLPILLRALYVPANVFLPLQGWFSFWYCCNQYHNSANICPMNFIAVSKKRKGLKESDFCRSCKRRNCWHKGGYVALWATWT